VPLKSLSARLLILTAFFVMVGEVLIFVPSVARYRMTYFENRLAAGYIATLALDASPTGHLEQSLIDKLLSRVGAQGVGLYSADGSVLRLDRADPPRPDFTIDLTHPNILLAIRGSFRTLLGDSNRILRVLGPAGADSADTAEVLLDEAPLRNELWDFGIRILELSLVLSLVTAALGERLSEIGQGASSVRTALARPVLLPAAQPSTPWMSVSNRVRSSYPVGPLVRMTSSAASRTATEKSGCGPSSGPISAAVPMCHRAAGSAVISLPVLVSTRLVRLRRMAPISACAIPRRVCSGNTSSSWRSVPTNWSRQPNVSTASVTSAGAM